MERPGKLPRLIGEGAGFPVQTVEAGFSRLQAYSCNHHGAGTQTEQTFGKGFAICRIRVLPVRQSRQQRRLRYIGQQEICLAAKTKRYALSRIRRMLFCAWLGITAEEAQTAPPYARVLAFNDKGREVLKAARKQATLPLITKPAHAFDLGGDARKIFEREALACDLYHLALPCWKDIRWGADWRQDAIYVK
jgi:hypothetical protein